MCEVVGGELALWWGRARGSSVCVRILAGALVSHAGCGCAACTVCRPRLDGLGRSCGFGLRLSGASYCVCRVVV